MKIRAAALLFALATVPAWAGPRQTQEAAPTILNNVHRIVMLGDSITQFGDGPGGYVWLVRRYLQDLYPGQGLEVINAGISGNKSTDMLARYQTDVLDKKPDLLTISVGVNDVWHGFYDNHPLGDGPRGIPLAEYKKNVESMVTQAEKITNKIVILSTTVIHEELDNKENAKAERYNAALQDIAKRHHLIFCDYQKPFRDIIRAYRRTTGGRDDVLTGDGVHMNGSGNRVMAHTLLTAIGISPEAQASVQAQVQSEQNAK